MLITGMFVLVLIYMVVLFLMAYGFLRTPGFTPNANHPPSPVSILVCARNEEKVLPLCLKSILAQDYPMECMQIIVVNDGSHDKTEALAQSILASSGKDFLIIRNNVPLGKKASLALAIEQAKHELIITRDADTFTASPLWLRSVCEFQNKESLNMLIGPVQLTGQSGLLWALQCAENITLSIISAGAAYFQHPFLCSGANLLFQKSMFRKVNGYQSHSHIPSGDDVLFLEDIKQQAGARIQFLKSKEALVTTFPQPTLAGLFRQKIRWAQKFKVNPNRSNLWLGLLVFLVNSLWILAFVGLFLFPPFQNYWLLYTILKLLPELILLFLGGQLMTYKQLHWYAFSVGLVYPFYATAVALASIFVQPKWK